MTSTAMRTQTQRRIATLAHPRPGWSDQQRRAWETAKAACEAFLAIGDWHDRRDPLGELEQASYRLWMAVETQAAPLFEGEE